MMEVWKNCYGFEDSLQVSNLGRLRSFDRYVASGRGERFVESRIYKQGNDKDGYKLISVLNKGKQETGKVHRLVMMTFRYTPNFKSLTVNHLDGDKRNNKLENLDWATQADNVKHAWETGLAKPKPTSIKHKTCPACGNNFLPKQNKTMYCGIDCARFDKRKTTKPSKEDLKKDITSMPMTKVGNKYGVSDNAVRKWCKSYGLPNKAKDIKNMK